MMNRSTKEEAAEKFRKLGTQLVSRTRVIPFYDKLHSLFGLPSIEKIKLAHHSLISLSNSGGHPCEPYKIMEDLKKELNLWFLNE